MVKLTLFILFCSFTQVKALAQPAASVNMDMREVTLDVVFTELGRQAKCDFLYNHDLIASKGKVSVVCVNEGLTALLDRLLVDYKLGYKIDDRVVIIREAGKAPVPGSNVIRGSVKDLRGNAVVSATVAVKGTGLGVITDVDGKFVMELPQVKNIVLVFSCVGMKTKEVTYKGEETLNIQMEESVTEIEEIVITGYTPIRKSSFTGNATIVTKEELLKVSKTNVIQALQAFDPSFRIQENNQWGSDPNALPEMYIRGRSGIGIKELDRDNLSKSQLENNPNLPLFIMDGFEISVQKLYDFDPNRIENVTILKDAAATAMYGSRAANGVVVITTVVPKAGKLAVSYSMTGTVTMPDLTDYNLMNAREKLETEVAAEVYQSDDAVAQYYLDQEYYGKLNNVLKGVNTYWLSKPLRTTFNHKHSLTIEGGGENLRFGVDLMYNNDNGVMKESYRDRMGAGIYLDYRVGTLQLRNYISYNVVQSKESPYGVFSDYTSKLPYDEYTDESGRYLKKTKQWHGTSNDINPLYEAGLYNFDRSKQEEFIDNLSANWYVTDYLQLKGQISVTKLITGNEKFLDPESQQNSKPLSVTNTASGELSTNDGNGLKWDMNAFLAYNRTIDRHNLNFNVGVNALMNESSTRMASYRGFPSGALSSINYAQEIVTKPTVSQNKTRLFGMLGTLNYSYQNIYLLDASVRVDGSSEFGVDNKFAPFWSGGLGVNIHNYQFFKDREYFDVFRVKGSYGVTGKVNFPPYAAQTIYEIQNDEWYKTGFGASLMALGNKNLGWEKTKKLNVGVDLEALNGIVQFSASYYREKTVDLINSVTIAASAGFSTYMDNIGEVMNKGFDFTLRSNVINTRDLFVSVFFNMARNENKILKISESLKAYNEKVNQHFNEDKAFDGKTAKPLNKYIEGESLTSIFAMRSLGIDPATGQELLVNRDGSITYNWNTSEQVAVGNSEPAAQGAFGFNVRYKNFALYTTFLYEFGGQRYNTTLVEKVEDADVYNRNVDKRVFTDRWKKAGDHAKYKAIQSGVGAIEKTYPSARFVQDYNVLSLNSLTLSYDFDTELIKKAGLGMLRLEVGANELLRFSSVKAERGMSYPYARNVNVSLKLSF